ncbi:MAG: FAD-dependent oxidoreductase [Cyanobacteria bacterium P01_A01_bin.105]
MLVDYDLVIVGGTLVGRWAALRAALRGARVVLVEPPGQVEQQIRTAIFRTALGQRGAARSVTEQGAAMPSLVSNSDLPPALTLAGLATNGVDVVLGQPRFCAVQPLQLTVGTRCLTARSGLLALAGVPCDAPRPDRLVGPRYSPGDFLEKPVPTRVVLTGQQAAAVEWAAALVQQMATVVLLSDRLLPTEDRDIQRLVGVQLRAMGVRLGPAALAKPADPVLLTPVLPTPVLPTPVLLTDVAPPPLAPLGLPGRLGPGPLTVNPYLRTSVPGVYAIGSLLGGENRPGLAQAEAAIAVDNALFWPRRRVRYDRMHYSLTALTPVGRAGLTEQQARQYYAQVVCYQSGAAAAGITYGVDFCKLVVADRRLVGVHLMGTAAAGAIALLAPYLGQPFSKFAQGFSHLSGLADTQGLTLQIAQALAQHQDSQWQPGHWRRDWAENWFNWRRSRG